MPDESDFSRQPSSPEQPAASGRNRMTPMPQLPRLPSLGLRRFGGLLVAGACALLLFLAFDNIIENVSAEKIVVNQRFYVGTLDWWLEPGVHWQLFGKVTTYRRSTQFWFSSNNDQGSRTELSMRTRFNDGGHANISGSVRFDLPLELDKLTNLHIKYGSQEAIEQQLIRTVMERAVYMTGPLMSSRESYSEKRPLLLTYIEDQAKHGVYKTTTTTKYVEDPVTGDKRQVTVSEPVLDSKAPNGIARMESSSIEEYGIKLYNLSMNMIAYDQKVEQQITQQQQITMDIQTKKAEAAKAEQDAITAEQKGRAAAAESRWKQEAEKAMAVVRAEQDKQVAELAAQKEYNVAKLGAEKELQVASLQKEAAEQLKGKLILEGQGESEKRRLIMQADNALETRLAAWREVNRNYAEAIARYSGNWVPQVQLGSAAVAPAGVAGNTGMPGAPGAYQLIDLLTAKTARDLALDLGMSATSGPAGASGK
ncbi:SPFH domain-containing protein [Megalodesulfovibrio paquesii]